MKELWENVTPFAGIRIPIYLTADRIPSATFEVGSCPHKGFIISIPKAGTYLVAELLRLLGCVPTQLHIWKSGLSDYRQAASIQQMREEYARFNVEIPLSHSLRLVHPGQFAVGHLECDVETRPALSSFKTLFVYRELRDAFVSWLRFYMDAKRGGTEIQALQAVPDGPERTLGLLDLCGQWFFGMVREIIPWMKEQTTLCVRFETLYGDHGTEARHELVRDLYRHFEVPNSATDVDELINKVIGARTLTWSGKRSQRGDYWNEQVESRFRDLGGPELNAQLGY